MNDKPQPDNHGQKWLDDTGSDIRAVPQSDAAPADETDAQMLARLSDDASAWAAEFRKTALKLGYSDMDEGWLISWFANAIVTAQDKARPASPLPADDVVDRGALLKKLKAERDEYFHEHFVTDPETGAAEASSAKEEYLQYLEETIEKIENFPAANLLRQSAPVEAWKCKARNSSAPDPQDCDWPVCGCDPHAEKVISALEEMRPASPPTDAAVMREACAKLCDDRAAENKASFSRALKTCSDFLAAECRAAQDELEALAIAIRALPIPESKTDAAGPGSLDDPNMYHYGTPSEPVADAAVKALVYRLNYRARSLRALVENSHPHNHAQLIEQAEELEAAVAALK